MLKMTVSVKLRPTQCETLLKLHFASALRAELRRSLNEAEKWCERSLDDGKKLRLS